MKTLFVVLQYKDYVCLTQTGILVFCELFKINLKNLAVFFSHGSVYSGCHIFAPLCASWNSFKVVSLKLSLNIK